MWIAQKSCIGITHVSWSARKNYSDLVAYLHKQLHQSVNKWTDFMWLGKKSNDEFLEHGSRALGFVDVENFLGS